MAPEALLSFRVFGKPVRAGVGLPMTLGATGNDGSIGIAFRLVLEPKE